MRRTITTLTLGTVLALGLALPAQAVDAEPVTDGSVISEEAYGPIADDSGFGPGINEQTYGPIADEEGFEPPATDPEVTVPDEEDFGPLPDESGLEQKPVPNEWPDGERPDWVDEDGVVRLPPLVNTDPEVTDPEIVVPDWADENGLEKMPILVNNDDEVGLPDGSVREDADPAELECEPEPETAPAVEDDGDSTVEAVPVARTTAVAPTPVVVSTPVVAPVTEIVAPVAVLESVTPVASTTAASPVARRAGNIPVAEAVAAPQTPLAASVHPATNETSGLELALAGGLLLGLIVLGAWLESRNAKSATPGDARA